VHDIQVTRTDTALEAALLEHESIKELQPPYNVQLVGGEARSWFVDERLDTIANEPSPIHRHGPLPSTFSVRALGAIEKVLSGEDATRTLRARAMGVHERWAPGADVFGAGLLDFTERHAGLAGLEGASTTANVRRELVKTARKLILMAKAEFRADDDPDDGVDEGEMRLWDRERVVRHLERGVMHGYQLLQRARWLCLLYESAVVFREPMSEKARLLLIQAGKIVEAHDLIADETVPIMRATRRLCERQGTFDRNQYDRLRTLTSELKRVLRDGGTAAVRVGRARWLRGTTLDALMLWV
jgi:DNA polymerase III subunit epsilon